MNPDDKLSPREFDRIAVLDNAFEAQLISSILNEMNIPHRVRSYHDTALDGLYQVQKGWGELDAPVNFQDEILEVLDRIRTEKS